MTETLEDHSFDEYVEVEALQSLSDQYNIVLYNPIYSLSTLALKRSHSLYILGLSRLRLDTSEHS